MGWISIYNGFFVRYIRASRQLLGQMEDWSLIPTTIVLADDASTPRLNQDVMEEVEQNGNFQIWGLATLGYKNRNLTFFNVQHKYPNFDRFLEAKRQLNPLNIFSTVYSDEI